jgi:hypothetical protein
MGKANGAIPHSMLEEELVLAVDQVGKISGGIPLAQDQDLA